MRSKITTVIIVVMLTLCRTTAFAQHSAIDSIAVFHESTWLNNRTVEREMVYVHLDNTSYYRGDHIFFAGYLVKAGTLKPSDLSETVYVELLNPSGKVIDRNVLKAVDGRFHGSLTVNETPFYSGYYEVRAYSRYMLNFGLDALFSRVIPVYKRPKKEGDWSERTMLKYGSNERTYNRPKLKKAKEIEARFYPEGGRLVKGLRARVAFEFTDGTRRPLQATGRIVDAKTDTTVATFATGHMGRGAFDILPQSDRYRVIYEVNGKKYSSDLPKVEPEGISVMVDNLTSTDSVTIEISRTDGFPLTTVGTSITCRGELDERFIVRLTEDHRVRFGVSRDSLPTGVIELTLFDVDGNTLADRLFFNDHQKRVEADIRFDKQSYGPYEPVELDISLTKAVPFSLSVTDADGQISYGSNILADLLLASEIKGYVHNPAYYFEDPNDRGRQQELDHLLMVQGWRQYSWNQLAGLDPYKIDVMPEKGIEVYGKVLARNGDKPQKGMNISAMLNNNTKDTAERKTLFIDHFDTDDNGDFAFRADFEGPGVLTLSASKKGKAKPARIILDVKRHPDVRGYDIAELRTDIDSVASVMLVSDANTDTIDDSLPDGITIDDKYLLETVEVKGDPKELSRIRVMENSLTSYEIADAQNDLIDDGKNPGRTLLDMLNKLDKNFTLGRRILYKGKDPLFIIEDEEFALEDLTTAIKAAIAIATGTAPKHNRTSMLEWEAPIENQKYYDWERTEDERFQKYMEKKAEKEEKDRRYGRTGNDPELISANDQPLGNVNPRILPVESIEKVYIATDNASIMEYITKLAPPETTQNDIAEFQRVLGCMVLVELNSFMNPGQGTRRMKLNGYTKPVEFYSPDYSEAVPIDGDYRRTLYWNPDVNPDANGKAKVSFYNNSTAKSFNVSAASVSEGGILTSH